MPCWSRTAARHMMDRNGIHLSVRSVSDPGVRFGREALARCIVRNLNEYAASIVDERIDRFGFFVTLALLDVESVFEEIQCACDQLHADGVVLLANAAGKCLGDPLSCIVAHRTRPPCHHGVRPSGNTFPRTGATRADVLAGLSAGDVQDGGGPDSLRCIGALPEDQIYPCPWRGIRALSVYRALLAMIAWEPAQRKLLTALCQGYGKQKNIEAFRRFYWGMALIASPADLPRLFDVADPGSITFGTDWPFTLHPVVKVITRELGHYPMPGWLREATNHGNALRLFPESVRWPISRVGTRKSQGEEHAGTGEGDGRRADLQRG